MSAISREIITQYWIHTDSHTHTHTHTQIYVGHSIKSLILQEELAEWTIFRASLFSRKSIMMSHFLSLKRDNMTFFSDLYARNFFFTGESVCFILRSCVIDLSSLLQTHKLPIYKYSLIKRTSLNASNILHINHIWFEFLGHQKFNGRTLFKPGVIYFICSNVSLLFSKGLTFYKCESETETGRRMM